MHLLYSVVILALSLGAFVVRVPSVVPVAMQARKLTSEGNLMAFTSRACARLRVVVDGFEKHAQSISINAAWGTGS